MTTKDAFLEELRSYPRASLAAVLESIDVDTNDETDDLADAVAEQLWKHTHTPIGGVVHPHTLESILTQLISRLDLDALHDEMRSSDLDGWHWVDRLCDELLPSTHEVHLDDISEAQQKNLRQSALGILSGVGTMGSAYLSRLASLRVIQLISTPLLPILRRIPTVGPTIIAIRTAAGVILRLSGPIGIIAAVLSINAALGPNWDKALRILLGVGLIRRTAQAT
jgi:hypothetical protein